MQLTQLLERNGQNINSPSKEAYYGWFIEWTSEMNQKKHYMSAAVFSVALRIVHRWWKF